MLIECENSVLLKSIARKTVIVFLLLIYNFVVRYKESIIENSHLLVFIDLVIFYRIDYLIY